MPTQKQVWNNIAKEWHKFKNSSSIKNTEFIKSQTGRLLDLGCGAGRNFTYTNAEIFASDFSSEMIKFAKEKAKKLEIKKIKFFVNDADDLPFENEFFDSVIFTHVLYCIPDSKKREKAVCEVYRVLKKGGRVFVSVWNKNSKRFIKRKKEIFVNWQDKGKRYYYLFDEDEIHGLFKKTGFKIIKKLNSEVNISFIVEK
ncbi:MAG: class I SAM-dependent methyltransferase [Candidatus Pacearchaeota archaeon]|jgi:ubiquinone/menaquinone biosynthesis C-methylase UbiE